MEPQVRTFLEGYGRLTNRGIAGDIDGAALAACFANSFVASSPAGVMGGNAEGLADVIADSLRTYARIGATAFQIERIGVEPLDDLHALARVGWRFDYSKDGREGQIRFTNLYFVTTASGEPKIFCWITPDEQAALREHGLV